VSGFPSAALTAELISHQRPLLFVETAGWQPANLAFPESTTLDEHLNGFHSFSA
jgi:hypothetical protein